MKNPFTCLTYSVACAALLQCVGPALAANTDSGPSELDEIIVTAQHMTVVPKSGVPVLESPQNIQILSERLLKDQGVTLLEDALRNVAGVMPDPYARGYDFYRIRGFDASGFTFVDGLPRGVALSMEPAALDRIEVLKGPSSVLFGGGPPGGLVNLVTKHPRRESFLDLEISAASWGGYMPYVDAGTTFNQDQTVYGRLVALYRSEGSFIDFNPGVRRLYVAPSVTWDITPQTQLTVLAAVSRERNELIPDQPAIGFILPNPNGRFRRELYIGDPKDPGRIRQDWDTVGYELRHTLTDRVSLYQNARASYLDLKYLNLYQPLTFLDDQRTELQYGEDYGERRRRYSVDTGLNAMFDTATVQHKLNAGVEYEGANDDSAGELGFAPTIGLDLYNPDYSVFVRQPRDTPFGGATLSTTFGFYVQDELRPTDRLAFTIGGRYDVVRINGITDHAFVPRVGSNYTLLPGVVAYVSYAKSFNAQAGLLDTQGGQLLPEKGTQYEAGIKVASANGGASSTVSIFQLTRTNVANQVPGGFSYQATGEQRSRGIELDGQFKLATNWEMLASYSYLDAFVKADTVIPVGNLIPSTPKHKASLWMRYVIRTGVLSGLGFSAGGSIYSRQAGDDANSFFIPSYTLVNANVSYRKGPYSVLINANNVLDKDYVRGALGTLFAVRGDPRNYRITLGYSF